jgi:ATP-dependent protease ClpP protease subunit
MSKNSKSWYSIKASADVVDVYLYGEIGWDVSAKYFAEELRYYKGKPLHVHINSEGGSVFEGQIIHSALKSHDGFVKASIEGLCASISTIIAMGCDVVEMTSNSLYMIHSPAISAGGNKEELKKSVELLEKIEGQMISTYVEKTGLKAENVQSMLEEETWMNAEEALDMGFIDSIAEEVAVTASFDASKFKAKTEDEIREVLNGKKGNQINKDMDMTEENRNWIAAKFDSLVDLIKGNAEPVVEPTPSADPVEPAVEPTTPSAEELQAQIESLTTERDELLEANRVATEEQVDYGAELETMRSRIAQLEATPSTALSTQEPNPTTPNPSNEDSDGWDNMAKEMFK